MANYCNALFVWFRCTGIVFTRLRGFWGFLWLLIFLLGRLLPYVISFIVSPAALSLWARWTDLNQNLPRVRKWVRFQNACPKSGYPFPYKLGPQTTYFRCFSETFQLKGKLISNLRNETWYLVAYLGGIRRWPPRVAHPNFQAWCIDVWYEAFCCRHINFKTVFQSVSKHAIFIQKIENFSGGGHSSPNSLPHPLLGAYGSRPSRIRCSTLALFPRS